MKKDIDFDKISEEVLTEFLASIKTDSEAAKIQIENIAKISSRVCSSILAKYHQELLKDYIVSYLLFLEFFALNYSQ